MSDETDRAEGARPPVSDAPAGASAELLVAGIEQVFNGNDDRVLASVGDLRRSGGVLEAAQRLYAARSEDSASRWGIVYLASQAGGPGTADWLTDVATRPLPEVPDGGDEGCESPRDNELLVRVMAVEGLGVLAESEGRRPVAASLISIVSRQPDPVVRSAAVVQALQLDPEAGPRLREVLPASQHHLVDVELRQRPSAGDDGLGPVDVGNDPDRRPPLVEEKGR